MQQDFLSFDSGNCTMPRNAASKQSSREKSKLRDGGMQKLNRLWCPRGEICMKYRSLSSQMNAHILLDNTNKH